MAAIQTRVHVRVQTGVRTRTEALPLCVDMLTCVSEFDLCEGGGVSHATLMGPAAALGSHGLRRRGWNPGLCGLPPRPGLRRAAQLCSWGLRGRGRSPPASPAYA